MSKSILGRKTKRKPATAKKRTGSTNSLGGGAKMSSEHTLKFVKIILHGLTGAGKTFVALTASKHHRGFPAPGPKKDWPVIYDDLFWIGADDGALDGASTQGIDVPSISILELMSDEDTWRAAEFQEPPNIIQASMHAAELAAKRVLEGKTEWVVIDTASSLDVDSVGFYASRYHDDGRSLYRANLGFHSDFLRVLRFSGAKIIICAHSEAVSNTFGGNEDAKNVILTADGGKYKIAISGKSAGLYKRHSTCQWYIKKEKGARIGQSVRWAYSAHSEGETKSRFEDCLENKEKPDIRAAIAKIESRMWKKT